MTQAAGEDQNMKENEHQAVISTLVDQVALQERRGAKQYLKDARQAQEPRVGG